MKRFLFAILAIVIAFSARGASVLASLDQNSATITYQSVDVNNDPVTLSAKIYWPSSNSVDFVMINNHATITNDDYRPTGGTPLMNAVKYMTTEDALVICPDYLGFGESNGVAHPYMVSSITGRNVLDAYKAAIKYVKGLDTPVTIASNYYTVNVGYSQGAAAAIAFQRYLETEASNDDRSLVNLSGSVCGAGPYNQQTVFDTYEGYSTLAYPVYLLYVLNGHKEAYGKSVMRKLELEECFTDKFRKYYTDTFKSVFEAKETNVDDLNTMLTEAGFNTFYSIINADYKDHTSKLYRTIHKALAQSNLLAAGWTPQKNIIFYHDKEGNDKVVPYQCTAEARTRFSGHCSYVDAIDDYSYTWSLFGSVQENYLWHPAVFHEVWKSDLRYPGQASVMAVAVLSEQVTYSYSAKDHRNFGARFYCQFLANRSIMRPAAPSTTGTASTIDVNDIVIETPSSYSVAATESSVAGAKDRVEMALPYPMVADEPLFLQFPTDLDGYYFGCDAPRYKVTLNSAGEVESYTEMGTYEDFKAGDVYLVASPDADETITFVSPALKKNVVANELKWRELNMRKPKTFTGIRDDRSYVSNYMPFAYKPVEGATAYAITATSSENMLMAIPFTTVPAGTGALIETSEATTGTIVLRPLDNNGVAIQGEANADNLLTGTYDPIPNIADCYYHFGKSNYGNLGYWKYPNYATVRAYSAFIDKSSSPSAAKGFDINFDDVITAIEGVNTESNIAVWGIDGKERPSMQKGINIVRMSDGTVKKVMVK